MNDNDINNINNSFGTTFSQNTPPLGKINTGSFLGLAGLAIALSFSLPKQNITDMISADYYNPPSSTIRISSKNTSGSHYIAPNKTLSDDQFLENFAILFLENQKDIPPEFNKTFQKNFKRLLA